VNFQNQIDYLQNWKNEDMLEGVSVPDPLDPETLKSQIVFRCGLLWPAYSEPEIQKTAITQFFKREQWNIQHLVNIILAEYSPIENTDRYSEHTTEDTGSGSSTHSGTDQRNIKNSGTDQRDIQSSGSDQREIANSGTDGREIQESGSTTTTREVSAYNSAGYQADNKETVDHGKRTEDDFTYGKTTDDSITYGKKTDDDVTYGKQTQDNVTYGHKVTDEKNGKSTYTEHTHGNIGVTTNQEMIRQELELLEAFDIYDWIAAKMEKELFLQIY
jgi:hypothetical protein